MKFICHKETLLKELLIAQDIISSKNTLSILSNIYLQNENNNLVIKSTDMKIGFETIIPVNTEIGGSAIIYCEKFVNIVRNLPDEEIVFEKKNGTYHISSLDNKISFTLKPTTDENYPELPDVDDSLYFELPQKDFIEMINQTIFAVSDDETRYFMNGVYFEKNENNLTMVATDGRRLSLIARNINVEIPNFDPIIIPPKTLKLISKLSVNEGMFKIAIVDKGFYIKFHNQKIFSNIIEGQFPNYKRVIPDEQKNFALINKSELNSALKRVSLLVEKRSRRIYLNLTDNNLLIKSDKSDLGDAKEDISCNYTGEETVIALNYMYLEDPLKVIKGDTIKIKFSEPTKAITLVPEEEEDYFHIIMPMQLE